MIIIWALLNRLVFVGHHGRCYGAIFCTFFGLATPLKIIISRKVSILNKKILEQYRFRIIILKFWTISRPFRSVPIWYHLVLIVPENSTFVKKSSHGLEKRYFCQTVLSRKQDKGKSPLALSRQIQN